MVLANPTDVVSIHPTLSCRGQRKLEWLAVLLPDTPKHMAGATY